jgi:YVTN family beta-propeller protein
MCLLGSGPTLAQNAYIPNLGSGTVSVIDTTTNKVTTTIPVGDLGGEVGVAVAPGGRRVYVANDADPGALLVIDTVKNTVIASIPIGSYPLGVAVAPDGRTAYVVNPGPAPDYAGIVSVIDTAINKVITTIAVGSYPFGVAVAPDGGKLYVVNALSETVSVINTATNSVIATIAVGSFPSGVAVTPDGRKVFVTNIESDSVSVISTATNSVTATIPINAPQAFGVFIEPPPRFAGTPGKANCYGQSVSALAKQYGGLNAAAAALGFDSLKALQNAIMAFCEG